MLIKIIKCIVNEDSKSIFHFAQTKWTDLKLISGFIAQVGGWNQLDKNEAVIIAVWESLDAYTFFMSEIHDKIITSNEQTQSYEQIEISLWKTNEIISRTEITNFKCSKLIDLRNHNLRTDDLSKKTLHMTQLKDEKVRKVLILNNELEETSEGNDEILLKFEKEWTV
ncbi:DUF4937 domain-containing protein [Paenibacillus silvae]|uniref:DUF4937 domain-containing protein n=1 Tax=Paenibacillus TaxID=44249 RepID=UPI001C10BCC2|nr:MULTISPECIES: DUF4937 domain-containing protein [Paenibacillus]MBU5351112.1 YdbC family protein [Paenibacillus barcinonensis]MDM5278262.1 DUF4937 domain-containing protein [Paenibacillus silvae]